MTNTLSPLRLGEIPVGPEHPPLIVAEMSGNHNQSLERALALVDAAAESGAQALKIQTYTADTMTLNLDSADFRIGEANSLWKGKTLYQLYSEAHTPWDWHEPIFERCRKRGILAFSTPFDDTAVDFLESLNVPCYKIASFENTDLALIRKVAATGKPVILSTGMATVSDLEEAVKTIRATGNNQIILLKCTSSYPASPEHTHLRTIPHLAELFQCHVGLSDHTFGIGAAVASVALGACLVEKHFTLSRQDGGPDAAFSLEEHELKSLVEETGRAWQALGQVHYGSTAIEKDSRRFRRSLYVVRDMVAGEIFGPENLRAIRPGYGLPTKHMEHFFGKKAAREIPRGTALAWDLLA